MANKRVSFNQKHDAANNTADDLFKKTVNTNNNTAEESAGNQEKRRQTYYLDEDIIEAIREMAYHQRKDKSELVRDLLRNSALSEYILKQTNM